MEAVSLRRATSEADLKAEARRAEMPVREVIDGWCAVPASHVSPPRMHFPRRPRRPLTWR